MELQQKKKKSKSTTQTTAANKINKQKTETRNIMCTKHNHISHIHTLGKRHELLGDGVRGKDFKSLALQLLRKTIAHPSIRVPKQTNEEKKERKCIYKNKGETVREACPQN